MLQVSPSEEYRELISSGCDHHCSVIFSTKVVILGFDTAGHWYLEIGLFCPPNEARDVMLRVLNAALRC
jgi:hypothetical protein